MKKINVLIIAVIAVAAAFMTSCKNDPVDFAAPTVTFTEGDQTVNINTAVSVSGVVYAEGELKHVIIKKKIISSGTVTTLEELTKFDIDTIYNFKVDFTDAEVTESFSIEVEATDKNDKTVSKTATITVNQPIATRDVSLQMYCALDSEWDSGTYGSATVGRNWSHNEATTGGADTIALIDFWYYYSDVTKALRPIIMSPDKLPSGYVFHNSEILTGAKSTKFKVLTTDEAAPFSDWASVTDDTDILPLSDLITDTEADYLEVGKIVAFKLEDGTLGVFKVNTIQGTYNANDYITIDIKIADGNTVVK